MEIKKLVIDRETWGTECLLTPDRQKCCLGFLALACGACPDEIDEEGQPKDVPNVDWPSAFIRRTRSGQIGDSKIAEKAMKINDHVSLTWTEKEKKLIQLFKRAGIQLSFVGKLKDEIII